MPDYMTATDLRPLIDEYQRDYLPKLRRDQALYRRLTTVEALDRASHGLDCTGGKMGHFHRRTARTLDEVAARISPLGPSLGLQSTFEDFLDQVERAILRPPNKVWGVLDLTAYDVAVYLGYHFGVYPARYVYPHRDRTTGSRAGAYALGIRNPERRAIPLAEFPRVPRAALDAEQIEHFLCAFRDKLRPYRSDRQRMQAS